MQVFFQEGRQTLEKFFYFQLCDIVHVSSTGAFFFYKKYYKNYYTQILFPHLIQFDFIYFNESFYFLTYFCVCLKEHNKNEYTQIYHLSAHNCMGDEVSCAV